MKKGRQDRIAETLTNVKGWVKGTPFTYKLLIDRIIQGKVKGEEIVHYNSSHTRISIPCCERRNIPGWVPHTMYKNESLWI